MADVTALVDIATDRSGGDRKSQPCQDLAFLAQLLVLPPKPGQLGTLSAGGPITAAAAWTT